jgi:predicted pyridoxine 5'-phosphate oxidase superfamily flavin-nucleotide-binding protein
MIDRQIEWLLLNADAKALATYSGGNLNVVPVSSIKLVDGKIWLIDYFMEKTSRNLSKSPSVSLVCWKAMIGFQVKGTCSYVTEGSDYDRACEWIRSILPDRVVKGLLIIDPTEICDIAPAKNSHEEINGYQRQGPQL